jgi:hypothetical protein
MILRGEGEFKIKLIVRGCEGEFELDNIRMRKG